MEIKLFTVPWESLGDDEGRNSPNRTDELLIHLSIYPDLRISEVEEAIIGALRDLYEPSYFHYSIESTGHNVQWGVSSTWHEVVAFIPPLVNSAVSGAVGALTYSIVQRIFEKLSASAQSSGVDEHRAIGLEACEVKAREYLRSQLGQEVPISLVSARDDVDSRYAFEFESGDRKVEVFTDQGGNMIGFRKA